MKATCNNNDQVFGIISEWLCTDPDNQIVMAYHDGRKYDLSMARGEISYSSIEELVQGTYNKLFSKAPVRSGVSGLTDGMSWELYLCSGMTVLPGSFKRHISVGVVGNDLSVISWTSDAHAIVKRHCATTPLDLTSTQLLAGTSLLRLWEVEKDGAVVFTLTCGEETAGREGACIAKLVPDGNPDYAWITMFTNAGWDAEMTEVSEEIVLTFIEDVDRYLFNYDISDTRGLEAFRDFIGKQRVRYGYGKPKRMPPRTAVELLNGAEY